MISVLLVALIFISAFSACGKNGSGNTVSIPYQSGKREMIVDSSDKINCDYLLVYHETASYNEIDAFIAFLEQLSLKQTSLTFQLCPDSLMVPKKNQKMILLGDTSYTQSITSGTIVDGVRNNNYYDYLLRMYDNCLTVNWESRYGREDAFNYILNTLLTASFGDIFNTDYSRLYLSSRSDFPVVTIDDINIIQYTVVVPKSPSYVEMDAAERLVSAIKDATGVEVPLVTDDADESTYEILVGNTNRGETYVASFFAAQRFAIAQYGTKLILRGGQIEATATAAAILSQNIRNSMITAAPLHMKSGYYLTGNTEKYNFGLMGGYELVYSDDFNSHDLDTEIWNAESLGLPTYGLAPSILEYNSKNVSANGAELVLSTYLGSDGYVTGNATTHGKLSFQYGFLEMRAKFHTAPSYWVKAILTNQLAKDDSVIQIDIFNSMANNEKIFASAGILSSGDYYDNFLELNDPTYECYRETTLKNGETFNDEQYHTYGVEWTETYVRFFLDGKAYGTVELTDQKYFEFRQALYLELSATVEMFDQEPDDEAAQWPTEFGIDWIRLYQKEGVGSLTFGDSTDNIIIGGSQSR